MKKKGMILIIAILASSLCVAQDTYHNPESVVYDPTADCYYVSNYGTYMIVIADTAGITDTLMTGMTECLGMHLLDNILYVSCNRHLKGINLDTGTLTFTQYLPASNWLDGITSDSDGNLYVVDTAGKIFKLNPETGDYHIFASGLPNYTQDVVCDIQNNLLLVVAWQYHSSIYAIDISDSSNVTEFSTSSGYFDGIAIDPQGNVYISSHYGTDYVYKYDNTLSNPPEQIPGNFDEPAGLFYNAVHDILAVPNFEGNTVDFIDLSTAIDEPEKPKENIHFKGSFPNPIHSHSSIQFSLKHNAHINIAVHNVKGELVSRPIKGAFESGSYSIGWDTYNLKPGVYFCTISSDEFSETKKVTLLR
jgi:DNA-binding beta-propeller fold protein YncE